VTGYAPPLYYVIMSPLAPDGYVPHQALALGPDGLAHYANLPRLYPTSPHDLTTFASLHIARLVTSALSVLTVLFAYLAGREATGRPETGLLAGAVVAFLPEFSFRASAFSGDALVTTLCALGTWLLMRLVRRGHTRRRMLVLGVVGGAAILAKVTGGVLIAGAATAIMAVTDVPIRTRVARLTPLLVAPLLALPWFVHNQMLYGDPLAQSAMGVASAGLMDPHPLLSRYFAVDFPFTLAQSFVGLFGWTNIPLPPALYVVYALAGAVIATGIVTVLRRRPEQRLFIAVCGVMMVAAIASVVDFNRTFPQPQGRYLFPALPGFGVIAALALEATPGWIRRRSLYSLATAAGLAGLDGAILAFVAVPPYGVHW
jgi:4-amino-4-deoxy-L-arabinose transferase-like glycosyltransferase